MNIASRIKKLEMQRQPRKSQTVWNFEKTTDDQLLRLLSLLEAGDTKSAARFSQKLIDDGFLSYRIIEV